MPSEARLVPPGFAAHIGDVPWRAYGRGRFIREKKDVGDAAGTREIGFRLERLTPGRMDFPLHWHAAEEEGFIAREGEGVLVQCGPDGREVARDPFRAGDAVVFPADTRLAHMLECPADADAPFSFLVFGERARLDFAAYPGRDVFIVRKGTQGAVGARKDGLGMFRATPVDYYDGLPDATGPVARDGSSSEAVLPQRFGGSERYPEHPAGIVKIDAVPARTFGKGGILRQCTQLSDALGARAFDVNIDVVQPGFADAPFHFHLGDEELFYILEGQGVMRLGGPGLEGPERRLPVRAGHCIALPAAMGIAHQLIVPEDAPDPLRMLTLATRAPVDVVRMVDSDKWMVKRADLPKEKLKAWGSATLHNHGAAWLDGEPLAVQNAASKAS